MNIIHGKKIRYKNPKDSYIVIIDTIAGNGIWREPKTIRKIFPNNDTGIAELRELIVALECCSKQRISKGLRNHLKTIPFFKKYLESNWYHSNLTGDDILKDYKIRYSDNHGILFQVNITNDDKMISLIKKFKPK